MIFKLVLNFDYVIFNLLDKIEIKKLWFIFLKIINKFDFWVKNVVFFWKNEWNLKFEINEHEKRNRFYFDIIY